MNAMKFVTVYELIVFFPVTANQMIDFYFMFYESDSEMLYEEKVSLL